MLGKGVTARDCLAAMAVVLPIALLIGALMGWAGNQFGLSSPVRLGVIVAVSAISGRVAQLVIARRVKTRAIADRAQG